MKKLLGIACSLLLLLAYAPSLLGAAAEPKSTVHFNLTCENENVVSKNTGDIITVTYTLENATEDAPYLISSLANEIYYDHTFFELVEGSLQVTTGLHLTTKLAVYSSGEHRVYYNGFEIPAKQYAAKQTIGTFRLKIIATSGSSTIRSLKMLASGNGSHQIASTDLAVRIGDAPITPIYQLSFDTNGGNMIFAEKQEIGTMIDLSGYVPVKSGSDFEGWYRDEELTERVSFIEMNEHVTVYAKWAETEGTGPAPETEAPSDTGGEGPSAPVDGDAPDGGGGIELGALIPLLIGIGLILLLVLLLLLFLYLYSSN